MGLLDILNKMVKNLQFMKAIIVTESLVDTEDLLKKMEI